MKASYIKIVINVRRIVIINVSRIVTVTYEAPYETISWSEMAKKCKSKYVAIASRLGVDADGNPSNLETIMNRGEKGGSGPSTKTPKKPAKILWPTARNARETT